MNVEKNISTDFQQGLSKLGFVDDDALFLINANPNDIHDIEILFHLNKAGDFGATAVYLRKQLNGSHKPQVYLFDKTTESFSEQSKGEIAKIQKNLWTSGEVPLACVFYNTSVTILDCTKPAKKNLVPEIIETLNYIAEAHELYNEQFAVKIKTGIFWEEEANKNKFKFSNSAYGKLIENIRSVETILERELKVFDKKIITKIIVQSILIKYLEERSDTDGNRLLSEKYFQKYEDAITFNDVLKKGRFVDLLDDLNHKDNGLNGNVFQWEEKEKKTLNNLDLSIVAKLLDTNQADITSAQQELFPDWRYFEFKYIPVELISRLYEEFLGEDKQNKGLYYTPAHLAKLLVDECLPLKQYENINPYNYQILDPACGSGIFLVLAFRRLVQIWKLQNWDRATSELPRPDIEKDLKPILRNIYGVDKEPQAVNLAAFSLSLALCDELEPKRIINELKFDDLRKNNLIQHNFFTCGKIKDKKFNLIIGNPPFIRGRVSDFWKISSQKIKIPQGQIALKFLSDALLMEKSENQYCSILKKNGLVCLIIKSSGLLYNSSSNNYKKALFSNYNVVQILDFTALARNKSLWDNGADVASAAVFVRNERPDFTKNILHLTFRRTKATKERITFEIDDYDLHFVNRQAAIENEFIWKNNLLGGGRIRTLVEKVQLLPMLQESLKKVNYIIEEGFEIGSKQNLSPDFIYKIPFLPTEAVSENGINYEACISIDKNSKFSKIPNEKAFIAPNLIIWENIGKARFPMFYNETSLSFKRRLMSIKSLNDSNEYLKIIKQSFTNYYNFYKFYILATSSEILINRNNTFLLKDLKNIPFIEGENSLFSEYDMKIINDSINYQADFIIHGEKSKILKRIEQSKYKMFLTSYGTEFSKVLNLIYEKNNRKFRLSDVVELSSSMIAAVFKFDTESKAVNFAQNLSALNIENLTENKISSALSVNRIIKIYPQKDTVVFVKPNQYRYWLSLTAYRDADGCFADYAEAGY
ncbi:MAG: N-6 DNA methylase [Prevotellaceae bacterium]|nr:N-6 DNA methylase [Prevotellaceae bacterium]